MIRTKTSAAAAINLPLAGILAGLPGFRFAAAEEAHRVGAQTRGSAVALAGAASRLALAEATARPSLIAGNLVEGIGAWAMEPAFAGNPTDGFVSAWASEAGPVPADPVRDPSRAALSITAPTVGMRAGTAAIPFLALTAPADQALEPGSGRAQQPFIPELARELGESAVLQTASDPVLPRLALAAKRQRAPEFDHIRLTPINAFSNLLVRTAMQPERTAEGGAILGRAAPLAIPADPPLALSGPSEAFSPGRGSVDRVVGSPDLPLLLRSSAGFDIARSVGAMRGPTDDGARWGPPILPPTDQTEVTPGPETLLPPSGITPGSGPIRSRTQEAGHFPARSIAEIITAIDRLGQSLQDRPVQAFFDGREVTDLVNRYNARWNDAPLGGTSAFDTSAGFTPAGAHSE